MYLLISISFNRLLLEMSYSTKSSETAQISRDKTFCTSTSCYPLSDSNRENRFTLVFHVTVLFILLTKNMLATTWESSEEVSWRCSVKKVFLKISQYSQENTCVGVSFNKVAGLKPPKRLKRLQDRCFL